MESERYLERPIRADLERKMVFLAGPRQVGKTTLARHILASFEERLYLDWDNREDLEASHRALTRWVEMLERRYHLFRARPPGRSGRVPAAPVCSPACPRRPASLSPATRARRPRRSSSPG